MEGVIEVMVLFFQQEVHNVELLDALVLLAYVFIHGNDDFRVIVANLEQVAEFAFDGFCVIYKVRGLDVYAFAVFFTDKVNFSSFYNSNGNCISLHYHMRIYKVFEYLIYVRLAVADYCMA